MDFKTVRIPYWGRAKYNVYGTGDSIRSIIQNYMGPAGGGSAAGGGDGYGGNENRGGNGTSFFAYLSKTSNVFPGLELVSTALTDTIYVYGFRDMENVQTLIGDMSNSGFTANYDIQGIPESGMTVRVYGNGTTGTSIEFAVNNSIPDEGTLTIPVAVNINDNPLDPYHTTWYNNATSVRSVNLTYSWKVDRGGSSNYIMDLSNERAGVNVSAVTAQGDILYPNSIAALTCSASTFIGTAPVEGVLYSINTQPQFHAQGLSISTENNKGLVHFASNFNFDGPTLPIDIIATLDNANIATKTMTIDKNYPGQDGQAAVTRWIVVDNNVVKFNPNTSALTPSYLYASAMTQVGGDEPFYDTGTTIYCGYDTNTPTQMLTSSGLKTEWAVSSYTFALKNTDNVYYEIEKVPTIWDGYNGESGATGDDAWYLTLDNDNASINCDASGNILTGAVKPVCHGKLYHGNEWVQDAEFSVNYSPATGVYTGVTNGILTISGRPSFNFTGDILNISVTGKTNILGVETERDVKTMTIVKSKAGADGKAGVSYWLEPNFTDIIYDPNTNEYNPHSITCSVKKQVGDGEIEDASDAYIKYAWQRKSDGQILSPQTYSTGIPVTTGDCVNNLRLILSAYNADDSLVDYENIDIIKGGVNGSNGGGSMWYLSLDNDNASINCNASGSIYPYAVRPVCHAKLYYGETQQTSAVYNVSYTGATGITTSVTNGVLTIACGQNFNFDSDVLYITVDGMSGNTQTIADTKIMTISKNYAGTPGEDGTPGKDAITYWLVPSSTEIIYHVNKTSNKVDPAHIDCQKWKQEGQNPAASGSSVAASILYQMRYPSGSYTNQYNFPTTGVDITENYCTAYTSMRLTMVTGTSSTGLIPVDVEDIDIIRDGTNGTDGRDGTDGADGKDGRNGAAIRGPYDYYQYSGVTRDWCNGETSSTISDCDKWIDVVVKDGVYYYCKTAIHNGMVKNYINNSTYFVSGQTFDFIATNLLLASAASINFLTNNELYLRDSNNQITAGAKGGDSVNFWAGSNIPADAPFKVKNDGSFSATTGRIGPYTLTSQGLSGSANTGTIPGVGTLKLVSSYSLAGLNITVSASTYRDEYIWNQAGITAQKKNSSNQTTKLTTLSTGGLSTDGDISRSGEQVVTANDASSTKAPILHIVHCTQAEYNSMTKDNNTMYVIE